MKIVFTWFSRAMKLFYFYSIFCALIFINPIITDSNTCLILNGENKCHDTCETCNQCGDPKTCTSCREGHFKFSASYYDEVFECKPNCDGFSKEIHGKHFLFCSPPKRAEKFTQTSETFQKPYNINLPFYQGFDTSFILIILFSILIIIIVCFNGIAATCYCHFLLKKNFHTATTPPSTATTDLEANGAAKATEPLVQQVPQRLINNAMVYNNLEILNTDNYKLGEIIGGGSYSRVYEGELDGKQVAIKMALREGRKSIHKELQIYDKVSHPNILPALGVHLAVENLLFMPLRKFNLADYFIDYGVTIEVNKLYRYCMQISGALKYLHEKEILHCDLKVENILVKDDDGEELEISDFGCAIDLGHDREARYNGTVTHTAYELVKAYLNPEIKPRGTKASDVWAFAVTIWQIYNKSGRIPNDFISPRDIVSNYEKGKKLPKPKDMPDRMWRYVIMQCFDLQPTGRPTVKEINDQLTTGTF